MLYNRRGYDITQTVSTVRGAGGSLVQRIAITAALLLLPVSLCAQWLDFATPGIPRTADGKPNLTAPAPRTPNGKPELSGIWQPEINPYRFDLIQDPKDEAIFRPAAAAILMERVKDFHRDDPVTNCLPTGPSEILNAMYRIIQTPTLVALLYESGTGRYRQIYMDGRKLPKDPNPTWMGYSVGYWEGDTLVVESVGFNDRTWLDRVGHPHTERLRITERYRRRDFGNLDLQVTFSDPAVYAKPWTVAVRAELAADTEMIEFVCNESGHGLEHWVGKASDERKNEVPVPAEILAKYVGTYE